MCAKFDDPVIDCYLGLPGKFSLNATFDEPIIICRLKNTGKIRSQQTVVTYSAVPPVYVGSELPYQKAEIIDSTDEFAYQNCAILGINMLAKYKLPEIAVNILVAEWARLISPDDFLRVTHKAQWFGSAVNRAHHSLAYQHAGLYQSAKLIPFESTLMLFCRGIIRYQHCEQINESSTLAYENCEQIVSTANIAYENCEQIVSTANIAYEQNAQASLESVFAYESNAQANNISNFPYKQTTIHGVANIASYSLTENKNFANVARYDLLAQDKHTTTTVIPATFEQDFNAIFANAANASIGTSIGVIDPIRLEVSTSLTESVWQISAQISPAQSPLVLMNDNVVVSFNGFLFNSVFSGKSVTKSAQTHNVSVEAYSKTRGLSLITAPTITAKTSTQAFYVLGFNSLIGLINSNIKALDTVNQSVLSVASSIANDMGATIISRPNGMPSIIPTWKPTGSSWVIDESDILELQESFVDGIGYNRIVVSDGIASANKSIQTEVIQDGARWLLYVYGIESASVSHTQSNATIDILGGIIISKAEQVEFIDGVANLSYPINSIVATDWINNSINDTYIIDGSSIRCGAVGDYGLAMVNYTVKPLAYRITYDKTEPIQLIIKEK